MSAAFPVAVPTHLQRRGEIVGWIVGLGCFPCAFFGETLGALLPAGPAGIVLPMAVFSALAGAMACAVVKRHAVGGFAPRVGIRAGIVAALVGGALIVFAATLHAFGLGIPANSASRVTILAHVLPNSRPFQILVLALLGLPPAVFFGMAGALLTAIWHTPSSRSCSKIARPKWALGALLVSIFIFSAVGYLSPFSLPLRPKAAALTTAPAIPPPVINPASIPKWRYQKPPGFDEATAGQIVFTEQRSFGDVQSSLPMAFSPDEQLLAYFVHASGLKLEVRDLATLDVIARAETLPEPSALAWSPDAQSLLVVSARGTTRRLQVCRVTDSQVLTLPLPPSDRVPESEPKWWQATEVLFTDAGTPKVLNLDSLRLQPAVDSTNWKVLSKEQQEILLRPTSTAFLPANSRWHMNVGVAIRRYTAPLNSAVEWSIKGPLQVIITDAEQACRRAFPVPQMALGDLLLAPRDGTKLLHFHDQQATVFYLGLRNAPQTTFHLAMPGPPDPTLAEPLAKRQVCALICAPIINPLNGKTVGPDREQVKALARFAAWQEKDAQLWIEESYLPFQSGDVIADLHVWEDHRPRAVGSLGPSEWFAVIDQLSSSNPPARLEAPFLERQFDTVFSAINGVNKLERVSALRRPKAPPQAPSPPQTAPMEGAPPRATNDTEQVLTAFLTEHHAKSSRGDVEGLVADYADRVDHFNHGVVNREFIRDDELEYHSPGTRVTETIIKPPVFSRVGRTSYAASYSISFHRVRSDGRWTKGVSDIELHLDLTTAGPRIVRQRAQAHSQEKGR